MIVVKGKYSGFCFGVQRAINTVLSYKDGKNYVLGELIHNDIVINNLKKNGIKTVKSIDEIDFNDSDRVFIRTHGEAKSTFDKLREKNIEIVDCTCPFVKNIQKIVHENYLKGHKIIIVGDKNHPEVIGINGWCDNQGYITENPKEFTFSKDDIVCIVSQTTYSQQKFDNFIKNFDTRYVKKVDIFKTICYTTNKRQSEAEELSKNCDAILVLGGVKSNNTNKLYDICANNCKNVFRITDPKNFEYEKIKNFNKVGIVFGASTPIEQFQEVIRGMEEVTEVKTESNETVVEPATEVAVENKVDKNSTMSEFQKAVERIKPSRDYRVGQIVTAKISSANDEGLTLTLNNSKKDFVLPKNEMLEEYNKENYVDKIGSDIRVMVIAKSPLAFSEKAMAKVIAEEKEIAEIKNGKIFEAVIDGVNKGGLTGKFGSYAVFVPASQIRLGFVKELDKYIGKKLRLKAEKVETKWPKRQIVGSQRVILEAEKAERDAAREQKENEFLDSISEGMKVTGTPVRFTDFGAFVSVGGFDCLAHISDLSWNRCNNCSEVLEIGKEYVFKVISVDKEKKRVSLGYKQLQPKPWDSFVENHAVDDVVTGKVVKILDFGAFVEVEKGIHGLVRVSQISNKYLENPSKALEVGQEVTAKIIEIDPEREKLSLSIKALLPEEPAHEGEVQEEKKGKHHAKKAEDTEQEELHEWKDAENSDVSIADLINKD